MKRFVSMLTVLLALGACSNHEGPEGNPSQVPQTATLYHGMIQLGEKLEDPYTVENMRAALTKAYPTKADRIDITATDLYVTCVFYRSMTTNSRSWKAWDYT